VTWLRRRFPGEALLGADRRRKLLLDVLLGFRGPVCFPAPDCRLMVRRAIALAKRERPDLIRWTCDARHGWIRSVAASCAPIPPFKDIRSRHHHRHEGSDLAVKSSVPDDLAMEKTTDSSPPRYHQDSLSLKKNPHRSITAAISRWCAPPNRPRQVSRSVMLLHPWTLPPANGSRVPITFCVTRWVHIGRPFSRPHTLSRSTPKHPR